MSRIVIFIQNFSKPAGSERVASILASELAAEGNTVSVVSICGDNTCYYPLDKNVKMYTLFKKDEIDNRKCFLGIFRKLYIFYALHDVDIVIDVFSSLSIYTLLLKVRYRYKNISWEHFNYKVNSGMNKLGRRMAVRFSNQIITLTNTDRQYYMEANPKHKAKIDYIYNPSPYQNTDKIEFSKREKLIISVGRLTFQKGFDRLINMWERIEDKIGWKILIFGDGEERDMLQSVIEEKKLKNIKLMGVVKNIDEYYRKASLYVSTARFEGLPMTMIEAQSFGLPIISFDYDTGPAEIITDNADGYLITGDDEEQLLFNMANAIIEFTENMDKRKEFSEYAYMQSCRFKSGNIFRKWKEILEQL
jgi:glycosyltransferase involved in cell wall biosynthesis